jgi:hypothetical protein
MERRHCCTSYTPALLKFSAAVDHYMGGRRTRGPLRYQTMILSRATALSYANGGKTVVK